AVSKSSLANRLDQINLPDVASRQNRILFPVTRYKVGPNRFAGRESFGANWATGLLKRNPSLDGSVQVASDPLTWPVNRPSLPTVTSTRPSCETSFSSAALLSPDGGRLVAPPVPGLGW